MELIINKIQITSGIVGLILFFAWLLTEEKESSRKVKILVLSSSILALALTAVIEIYKIWT